MDFVRCFNHSDRDAVGGCKACNKGLCHDCAADLGHGLACKGVHEQTVETYKTIIDRNSQLYGVIPKSSLIGPIFYGFMGLVFVGFGLYEQSDPINFPVIMGAGFIVFAVLAYRYNRKAFGVRRS
jgi:hypothetical protein